ncbi:MAG: hypothetical protein BroJett011_77940 [Chloroflexota bacterium]|nr:MAG: hypothetical protein BroJett011_77940 [Chloroflexota bacterium]
MNKMRIRAPNEPVSIEFVPYPSRPSNSSNHKRLDKLDLRVNTQIGKPKGPAVEIDYSSGIESI